MRFEQPWILLLMALVPVLAWWRVRRRLDAGLRYSPAEAVSDLRMTLRARLARLPFWLEVVALCLFVIALARPQSGGNRVREAGKGIAIYMVIDRSGSMNLPMEFQGSRTTRIEAAKRTLLEFVRGRESDPIGIVAFARQAETVSPLTLTHDSFSALLSRIRPAGDGDPENATAIGDALALAAARLRNNAGADLKSRVIILLTDGENTAGTRSVAEGAQVAAGWGIRVHAIDIGGASAGAQRLAAERDLNQLVHLCGGLYRNAQDGEALQSVYAEIDRLEKSDVARMRYTGGTEEFGTPLAAGFTLLLSGWVLSCTWLRRLP